MTAAVAEPVVPGRMYVVTGTHLRTEGRKTRTATALLDPDGEVVARSEQVWIAVDPRAFG
jgi:acyl-CoA thioesterase FadM